MGEHQGEETLRSSLPRVRALCLSSPGFDVDFHRYYEWLNRGKDKLPHFTKHRDGKLMLIAGLYDCVTLEGASTSCAASFAQANKLCHIVGESAPLWTFTIVTTSANSEFSWLHDRQPVILSTRDALDAWLDTSSQAWTPALTKLVEPYHDLASPLEWCV